MKLANRALRKVIIGLTGYPLLVLGIILVPLPGPGLLISFLAFYILSVEYDWADRGFQASKAAIMKIYEKSRQAAAKIDKDFS